MFNFERTLPCLLGDKNNKNNNQESDRMKCTELLILNDAEKQEYETRRRRKRCLSLRQTTSHHTLVLAFTVTIFLWQNSVYNTATAFVTPISTSSLLKSLRRVSTASTSTAASSAGRTSSLEHLTVKELRERVKEVSAERGILSKLKRKQDLIEFLSNQQKDNHRMQRRETHLQQASSSNELPLHMPPVETTEEVEQENVDGTENAPPLSLKEAAFQRVYQRYPALLHQRQDALHPKVNGIHDGDDENARVDSVSSSWDPIRQWQHPIYTHNNVTSDMDLVFVGTASCTPSTTRGVSCTALRLQWRRQITQWNAAESRMEQATTGFQGGTWLFDVGECTQLQVQRTASVRPSKITKIFLTHAHGDHTFGLPGLLCLMGQDYNRDGSQPPVDIYGPEGLRMWLRVAIRYSVSRIVPPYRVHELMDLPMAPEWQFSPRARRFFYRRQPPGPGQELPRWGTQGLAGEDPLSWISQASTMPLEASTLYGEIEGGRDIYPQYDHPLSADGAPVYEVEDEEDVKVYAAPMSHGIPCVGYVVQELPRPGRLRSEVVEPVVKRNVNALLKAGFKTPMKAMAVIKNLPEGASFTFPDGTVVTQEEAVEPQRQGRKVVVCGDTCDARALRTLAQGADIIVHEATNAYLEGIDPRDSDRRSVERDAMVHGHSTPAIAARFAGSVGAKRLVLNHFSSRYKGDASVESMSIMQRIEEEAIKVSRGELNETQVAAAWDLMVLPIPQG